MKHEFDLGTYLESPMSRRGLMGAALVGGAAFAGASAYTKAITSFEKMSSAQNLDPLDAYLLTFALNLEYLEAEFYTFAALGHGIKELGIATDGIMKGGATLNGKKVEFGDATLKLVALEIAVDEQNHVKLLREALGELAPAKPDINLNALSAGFADEIEFLKVGRAIEDTGVTAYNGAAAMFRGRKSLQTATGILAAEAYHMGNMRLFIAQKGIATTRVDGKDIPPPPTGPRFFAVDTKTALAETRTPREVMNIVYGEKSADRGGFFPNGMNVPKSMP